MFEKFKNVANLFVTVEEDATPVAQPTATQPAKPAPLANPFATSAPVMASSVNQEMLEILMKAIAEANLPGFDYIEFRDSVAKLNAQPMTEQQRFVTVFSTAQIMGVTLANLTSAVDHYIKVVDEQRAGFLANVQEMVKREVDTRTKTLADNDAKLADANKKIAELNEFIVKTQQESMNLQNEVALQQQQINNTTSAFEATYNMVVGRLNEDKTKLTTYLTAV